MLEANESLENIFENAVKEAEKRKHEYVTIEHVLLALIKDKDVGTVLHDFKVNVGSIIKDIEDYLNTKQKESSFPSVYNKQSRYIGSSRGHYVLNSIVYEDGTFVRYK